MPLAEAAQAVQRSAFPDAYTKWEQPAADLLAQLGGGSGLACTGANLAASGAAAVAINWAGGQLGKPYQWGATGPDSFDCSGLTGWAYRHAGVDLPRTSREQWFSGPHPGLGYLQPGDLLFWATDTSNPATIHHVALYLGGDQMIAAPHTGTDVQIQPVYLTGFIGAVRPTAARTSDTGRVPVP
jgi:cell wall-associated NlpC family hydrolase